MKRFGKIGLTCSVIAACGWLGSILGNISSAQSQTAQPTLQMAATPVTYMTLIDEDHIVVQITEGEFLFHGWLERTSGNTFVGEDEQVRVMYDRGTSQLVVINVQTGDEFYNYTFSMTDEGAL